MPRLLAVARTAGAIAALTLLCSLRAMAMTTDAASIVALVKAAPQLRIDPSAPIPGGADRRTHPFVLVGHAEGMPGGAIDPDYASIGRLAGGTQVMAVPLESGGSGGVFTQIVFAQGIDDAHPFYAGYIDSGGHLGVNVTYHGIVAISPFYGPNDPNCCPSQYEIRTYELAGRALKLVARKRVTTP